HAGRCSFVSGRPGDDGAPLPGFLGLRARGPAGTGTALSPRFPGATGMRTRFEAPDMSRNWRHVYVVEGRNHWRSCANTSNAAQDLVLTYDFALCREIRAGGGQAFYADYLVTPEVMEANNHVAYDF